MTAKNNKSFYKPNIYHKLKRQRIGKTLVTYTRLISLITENSENEYENGNLTENKQRSCSQETREPISKYKMEVVQIKRKYLFIRKLVKINLSR